MKHTANHTATTQDLSPVTAMEAFRTLTLEYNRGKRRFQFEFRTKKQKEIYKRMLERNTRHYSHSVEGNTVTTTVKEV